MVLFVEHCLALWSARSPPLSPFVPYPSPSEYARSSSSTSASSPLPTRGLYPLTASTHNPSIPVLAPMRNRSRAQISREK